MKGPFKNDTYKKSRGGYSRLLEIKCAVCETHICNYQKDGTGMLKRMYLDRMSQSQEYSDLKSDTFQQLPKLICPHCSEILGALIIYKREDRPAYRLFIGKITKKIIKVV